MEICVYIHTHVYVHNHRLSMLHFMNGGKDSYIYTVVRKASNEGEKSKGYKIHGSVGWLANFSLSFEKFFKKMDCFVKNESISLPGVLCKNVFQVQSKLILKTTAVSRVPNYRERTWGDRWFMTGCLQKERLAFCMVPWAGQLAARKKQSPYFLTS